MKFTPIIAALSLLLAMFSFSQSVNASLPKTVFQGQVIEVNQDEEGSSIVIKTPNGIESVYVPRSRSNEALVERAIKAREMKTSFVISTQSL